MSNYTYLKFRDILHRVGPFKSGKQADKNADKSTWYWKISRLRADGWHDEVCLYSTKELAEKYLRRTAAESGNYEEYSEVDALEEERVILERLYNQEIERLKRRLSEINEKIKEIHDGGEKK